MRSAADNSFLEIVRATAAMPEKRSGAVPRIRELTLSTRVCWSRPMLALAATACLGACEPTVVVGQWTCPASTADASAVPGIGDPVSIPWSTGFENRFCDYASPTGFCTQPLQYNVVTSPTKNGHFAAAFTAVAEDGGALRQSRCVRQGVLPPVAYYGAWYYIPATATNTGVWNLFHFQGANTPTSIQHGLWDVSLVNGSNGALNARVFNFLWNGVGTNIGDAPPAPIASWFHLEFFLRRAKDTTGEASLYQDGKRVVDFTNLLTDDTNWAQWYVGNYVTKLNPPDSTLYVDDVTIAATLGWTPPP
jgi:hypothetical protein